MCKYDQLCVHSNDICDGVVHCMYGADDERLCNDMMCPKYCTCVNYVVLCVNLTDSLMLDDVSNNVKAIVLTNVLVTIKQNMFMGIHNLLFLNMSRCYFQRLSLLRTMFNGISNLKMLDLSFTNIHHLPNFVFRPLINLNRIIFSGCKLIRLYPYIFPKSLNLHTINMSKLFINKLHQNAFCDLFYLTKLDVSFNSITEINKGIFNCLENLSTLDMSNNQIVQIDSNSINQLATTQYIYVDTISQCCHLTLTGECISRTIYIKHQIYMCQTTLSDSILLRYTYCLIGTLVLILNISSVICRRLSKHHQKNIIFCINLAFSDSLVGLYFFIVSVSDMYFGDAYIKLNDPHLIALTCQFVSILPVLSNVMSNSIFILLTVQKLLVTRYYFARKYFNIDDVANQQILLTLIWLWWLSIVMFYVVMSTPDSLLCFVPYTVHNDSLIDAITIVLFILYGGVIFITACYIYYLIINHVNTVVRIRTNYSRGTAIGIRVVKQSILVLSSNFLSWIVMSVTIMMTLISNNNGTHVEKLLLCCSLPLNAVMNTFIYSFLPLFKSR